MKRPYTKQAVQSVTRDELRRQAEERWREYAEKTIAGKIQQVEAMPVFGVEPSTYAHLLNAEPVPCETCGLLYHWPYKTCGES